jgi:ferric-dicitrate binding protein FerR (iron transport regulator)
VDTIKTYKSIEELASDLDFIAWIKDPVAKEGLEWYAALQRQHDVDWIEEARELVQSIGFTEHQLPSATKARMWRHIEEGSSSTMVPLGRSRSISTILSIAASIAILVLAGWWFLISDTPTIETTLAAQVTQFELPDGSTVDLNAESSLSYSSKKWESERMVELEGEALFNVAKGQRFTVQTGQGTVEVLGTSFNVYQRAGQFRVSCYSGKVRVSNGNNTVLLTTGEQCQQSEGDLLKTMFQVDPGKVWTKGYYVYNNASLDDVFNEIERQFDVKINREKVDSKKKYTGFFFKSNLSEALQSVCWPMRLKFDINGKEIVISEE